MSQSGNSLVPAIVPPGDPRFQAILGWPFPTEPFHEAQVPRLLKSDVRRLRILNGTGFCWTYTDAAGSVVGFGSLDLCLDHGKFTNNTPHFYIPLICVHPNARRAGNGRRILNHLVTAAASLIPTQTGPISKSLFLDVYVANVGALGLYTSASFTVLNPNNPEPDPAEGNEPFLILAADLSLLIP